MATYFIADLHLNPPSPEGGNSEDSCTRFMRFCQAAAADMDALYILGDLFEVWIGDDAGVSAYQQVVDALSQLSAPVFVLHGNRDFLLGNAFCEASGARLLTDPSVISVGDQSILIAHGDAFCTDDSQYQQMRELVRGEQWQNEFLNQTIEQRAAQAAGFRDQSKAANTNKSAEIMDVNPSAVVAVMEEQGLHTLVHGHTHRPAQHTHQTHLGTATRWVVGSWQQEAEILRWDSLGPKLIKLNEFLTTPMVPVSG